MHGLLTHKNMNIPIKKRKKSGTPQPPKKADFGRLKAKMGRFSKKGLWYSFEILHGLLTSKNIRIPGPIGVRALPMPAGTNEGGHYWSKRSACAARGCWHKRRWPLVSVILVLAALCRRLTTIFGIFLFFSCFLVLTTVAKMA